MNIVRMTWVLLMCIGAAGAFAGQQSDVWACRDSHPAVVNPVLGDGDVLSLRGEWQFVTNRVSAKHTTMGPWLRAGSNAWWERSDARTIQVPGCWEAQGVGAPGGSIGWKCWWDYSPRPLRHVFSGEGWYRKKVAIPAGWKGKRVWLKIGGVNSQGWFWVNGERVAWADSYCGTYKYEITDLVRPGGDAWVVANVCNVVPSRRGSMSGSNSYGGIIRDIEMEATQEVFIDDTWVRGDFDGRSAEVNVEISGFAENRPVKRRELRISIEGRKVTKEVAGNGCVRQRIALDDFRPWSPESPSLYVAEIELVEDGAVVQTRRERFGVRKLETRGNQFFLNDKPFFLRGAGWHWIWPIEGLPPPDRELFLKYARKVRAAGFNVVRTHTSCQFPEFFEAADEVGLMVEPELPYYQDVPVDYQTFDPLRDMHEVVANFRRHPSFAILSGGNEGWFGGALSLRLYKEFKTLAPDRLMIGHDRWYDPRIHQADTSDYQGGPMTVWPRGSVKTSTPFVCHEYLNLCVKLDSRIADRFSGVWQPPTSRASRAAWLATNGLDLAHGDRLQDAQHVMQRIWRKYGFEAARSDPFCAGYSYWSLQDTCSPQKGTFSGQALFDPFWGEKPCGDTAESVAVYNSPSCLLLDDGDDARLYDKDPRKSPGAFDLFITPGITNRVRCAGDRVVWRFRLAHFGERPMEKAGLSWRLVADGTTLVAGERNVGDQPLGGPRDLAEERLSIPEVKAPVKATLHAELSCGKGGKALANSWDYWLFPKMRRVELSGVAADETCRKALESRFEGLLPASRAAEARVMIAMEGSPEAKAAQARGQSLVSLAQTSGGPNCLLGWWWMGSQMGMVLDDHPFLRFLPHDGKLSPLLFRIVREGTPLPVAGVKADDLVAYGEGGDHCYLYMADVKETNGTHRVIVSGLDLLSATPEGDAILKGVFSTLGCMRGDNGD